MEARICRDNLHALASAYARGAGITLATVSKKFYGNNRFFADLHRGDVSVSIEKMGEILDAMRQNWPARTEWPLLPAVIFRPPSGRRKRK